MAILFHSFSLHLPNPKPKNPNRPKIVSPCATFRRDVVFRTASLCFVSFIFQNPLPESLADPLKSPKPLKLSIANTKSWFQFYGDGFAIRVPPQFEDVNEPEDYSAGLSLYGDKSASNYTLPSEITTSTSLVEMKNLLLISLAFPFVCFGLKIRYETLEKSAYLSKDRTLVLRDAVNLICLKPCRLKSKSNSN